MNKSLSILMLTLLGPFWVVYFILIWLSKVVVCMIIATVLSVEWSSDNLRGKSTVSYLEILKRSWPL